MISVGDTITFTNTTDSNDKLCAKVIDLFTFNSFDELYKKLPLSECGYTMEDIDTACQAIWINIIQKKYSNSMVLLV